MSRIKLCPKTFRKGGGEYFDAASFNPGMQITIRFAAGYLHSLILFESSVFPAAGIAVQMHDRQQGNLVWQNSE